MKTVLIACVLWLPLRSSIAGTISGTVTAKSMAQAEAETGGGAYQSKKYKFVVPIDYAAMGDFVVYIDGPIPGTTPSKEIPKIVQKNASFAPHVLPIMAGTTVEWPNEDDIFHNVFSKSQ